MREILFRGKRIDTGEWVYGYYLYDPQTSLMKSVIYSDRKFIKVDPATVGQFTGLVDKNGTRIFEGDKIKAMRGVQEQPTSFYTIEDNVVFHKGSFMVFGKSLDNTTTDFNGKAMRIQWCDSGRWNRNAEYWEINFIEVIGNIHDSPQEGGQQ